MRAAAPGLSAVQHLNRRPRKDLLGRQCTPEHLALPVWRNRRYGGITPASWRFLPPAPPTPTPPPPFVRVDQPRDRSRPSTLSQPSSRLNRSSGRRWRLAPGPGHIPDVPGSAAAWAGKVCAMKGRRSRTAAADIAPLTEDDAKRASRASHPAEREHPCSAATPLFCDRQCAGAEAASSPIV